MTRAILTIITLLSLSSAVKGAESEPASIVRQGRKWTYLISGQRGSTTIHNHRYLAKDYHFEGTLSLEGKEYAVFRDSEEREIAFLREEGKKVYLYVGSGAALNYDVDSDSSEVMVYDFSCNEGASFTTVGFDDTAMHNGEVFTAEVSSTGILSYEGHNYSYQRLKIADSLSDEDPVFIEGLGTAEGLLPFPQFGVVSSGMTNERETLFSVTDADGSIIYKNTDLAEALNGNILTDLTWQYYEAYGSLSEPGMKRVSSYSIIPSGNDKYPYMWEYQSYKQWDQSGSAYGNDENGEYLYKGETTLDEARGRLREEDGKVYLSLDGYKLPDSQPYYYFNGERELCSYEKENYSLKPYKPKTGEEVVLYDYTVKVGDRYRTLVFGSVLCDVTVTKVTETGMLGQGEELPGGGKVIEVIPDITLDNLKSIVGNEELQSRYSIKYAEGIGNIYIGNYLFLAAEPYLLFDNGSYGSYAINNILNNSDGTVFYKGIDYQGESGVNEVKADINTLLPIFDLHGRRVTNPQPGSIYIRGGKKFVAK